MLLHAYSILIHLKKIKLPNYIYAQNVQSDYLWETGLLVIFFSSFYFLCIFHNGNVWVFSNKGEKLAFICYLLGC